MRDELKAASKYWSSPQQEGIGWWYNPMVHQHINTLVCGRPIAGPWAGLQENMRQLCQPGVFSRGVSIGCGDGAKELELLQKGIVETFELYEISQSRIENAQRLAETMGVQNRVTFHVGDVFDRNIPESSFDLVFWNNSLHHMLDVESAIQWSYDRLTPGGHLVMDDYVGPTRFQWSILHLLIATLVRTILPGRLRARHDNPSRKHSRIVGRPTIKRMMALDPTEAAESAKILQALSKIFPNLKIVPTGGVVYSLALSSLLQNFKTPKDNRLLQPLLWLDRYLAQHGQTHYAVAIATKNNTR